MWISDEGDADRQLQQPRQKQRDDEENYKCTDDNEYDEIVAEPDVTYGDIVTDPRARSSKVTSSHMQNNNDSVVYSDLQNIGACTESVAPSGDLYANVL